MNDLKITVLGCGSSSGVPLATGAWGDCNPQQTKNRRLRSSILIQGRGQTILVDTGPDLRQQLLMAQPERLDAVIYTHAHADHIHGVDDLRFYVYQQKQILPAYMSAHTHSQMSQKFHYLFPEGAKGKEYPPLLMYQQARSCFQIGDLDVETFAQPHGSVESLGIKIGKFAYSTDCTNLSDATLAKLKKEQLDVWIVDATRYKPHPSHAHVDMALAWMKYVSPKRGYFTHLSTMLDYDRLCNELPAFVRPLYDGQTITAGF